MKKSSVVTLLCLTLTAAGCARVDHLGRPPTMSAPQDSAEFAAMTEPTLMVDGRGPETSASLWSGKRNALMGDRRAATRGDILTVVIQIDDRAEMTNSSGRARSAADNVAIPDFAGLPESINPMLPKGATVDKLVDTKASSTFKGSGNVSRREKLTLRVAATVLEQMPNGVLRIEGTQEVRVNFEMRELTVTGFVRPDDIDRNNEISYDRIAGARISYGGRGQISDVQQPRYGQQVADMILPY